MGGSALHRMDLAYLLKGDVKTTLKFGARGYLFIYKIKNTNLSRLTHETTNSEQRKIMLQRKLKKENAGRLKIGKLQLTYLDIVILLHTESHSCV